MYRVYEPFFTTARSFVHCVRTVFHYCEKLCTGCTNRFSLLLEALYGVYEPFFTAARSFVQGVRTVFHYCEKLCTVCTNRFSLLREVLYRVYKPFRVSEFQSIAPAPPSRFRREVSSVCSLYGFGRKDTEMRQNGCITAGKLCIKFGISATKGQNDSLLCYSEEVGPSVAFDLTACRYSLQVMP